MIKKWLLELWLVQTRRFPLPDDHRFEVVAIAHKNVRRIWDVKGKRLCHPGLDTVDDWTKIFSTVGELFSPRTRSIESRLFLDLSYFSTSRI